MFFILCKELWIALLLNGPANSLAMTSTGTGVEVFLVLYVYFTAVVTSYFVLDVEFSGTLLEYLHFVLFSTSSPCISEGNCSFYSTLFIF